MEKSSLQYFLYEYVQSLKERSRFEKTGFKNGLDWLIVQYGLQQGWNLVRTPFSIDSSGRLQAKTEPEWGVDTSFLSENKEDLYIFVLKDEKLNNKNWTAADFDKDIRKAASPNMQQEEFDKVHSVTVITVYNKDDDKTGVQLYENLINEFPIRFGSSNQYERKFERWNINKVVSEIGQHIVTAELLPRHMVSQFRYICAQIKDFQYLSTQWLLQLEPNWINFVEVVLADEINANKINLLALSLYILKDSWKSEEKSYAGWIDLVEWAMIALWQRYYKLSDDPKGKILKAQIFEVWAKIYLVELETYFNTVGPALRTQHGISLGNISSDMNFVAVNDAFRAYWHLGRLGLLNMATQEIDFGDDQAKVIRGRLTGIFDLLINFTKANPATFRPLIDLHHIELYLVWFILYQSGRVKELEYWLDHLEQYLTIRKLLRNRTLPFVLTSNDYVALVERISNEDKAEDEESSSFLVLMLIELCFSIKDTAKRDVLLEKYVQRLANGVEAGNRYRKSKNDDDVIDLMSWSPPVDWEEKLINGSLAQDGVGVVSGDFANRGDSGEAKLADRVEHFVCAMRNKFPFVMPRTLPLSVCILACIKHKSPLPPEFWRGTIFPQTAANVTGG